jgi:hypothetical protein
MSRLRRVFLHPDHAENLAVFRITVAGVLLTFRDVYTTPQWAALPPSVRVTPGGLGPLLASLPLSAHAARIAVAVLVVSLTSGLVGFRSRTSFAVATAAGFHVLGVPQLSGTPFHQHHLLWFTALLAASPCGDALSIDAWLAWRRGTSTGGPPSVAYGLPIRIAWLLLGLVYFFPGVWKLRASGWAWIASDNLRNQMYAKWLETGEIPALRIDRYPWLCHLGAAAVVAFELSFVFLVFNNRTRRWAVGAALLFHAGAAYWMHIYYSVLWCCFPVFFDWTPLLSRVQRRMASGSTHERSPLGAGLVGGLLVLGVVQAGARGDMSAWPFACYPTFQWIASDSLPTLRIEIVDTDGRTSLVPDDWLIAEEGVNHHWGLSWSLMTGSDAQRTRQRLTDYWRTISRYPRMSTFVAGAHTVRFSRAWMSLAPEKKDGPPRRLDLIAEILAGVPAVSSTPE